MVAVAANARETMVLALFLGIEALQTTKELVFQFATNAVHVLNGRAATGIWERCGSLRTAHRRAFQHTCPDEAGGYLERRHPGGFTEIQKIAGWKPAFQCWSRSACVKWAVGFPPFWRQWSKA